MKDSQKEPHGGAGKNAGQLFVTYITLTVLLLLIYIVKAAVIVLLMTVDFDVYVTAETLFLTVAAFPSLIAAAGCILLDRRRFRRRTLPTYAAMAAVEVLIALMLLPKLVYYAGSASSILAVINMIMIIRDHIAYRRAEAKRKMRGEAAARADAAIEAKKAQNEALSAQKPGKAHGKPKKINDSKKQSRSKKRRKTP